MANIPDVPAEQEYFWSTTWQEGERAAEADFASGRTVRFSNPLDAVRWLLSDDEESGAES